MNRKQRRAEQSKTKSGANDPFVQELFNEALRSHQTGRLTEAEAGYRQVLALKPGDLKTLNNLGGVLRQQERFEEALGFLNRALAIMPDYADALNNMGSTLKGLLRYEEAIVFYKRALALRPHYSAQIYNNLLMSMIYVSSISPQELADTARAYGREIADPLHREWIVGKDKNSERRLRIGYVSPDFRDHAVNYFFEFLPRTHDKGQFEIFGYSCSAVEDHITVRLKPTFNSWRDIHALDDDRAADLIESDKIDILVDLAGHTAYKRLLVFARRPAPIQISWLGYPATTGIKAMDYRITDFYADPEGMTEHLNVEKLWRLPGMFCCYQAHDNSPAVIDHPPFEDNGYITFGCFNNFAKVTDPALKAWAEVMVKVPNSRLLLEITGLDGPKFRADVEARLERLGLPLDRVILEPRKRSNQFVLYNKLDIALDPFPCNGGTTTTDTLWMGVPLVTLAGKHFLSRLGVTALSNAGLPELIAQNVDEYVKIATDMAQDKDRLRALRHNLRDKVAASPVMDQERFTRNMEAAYREMWRKYRREL